MSNSSGTAMQQSDLDGIRRSGAEACGRGVPYFANPHHSDKVDWLPSSAAWATGWREADMGRDAALAALDRMPFW